MEHFIKGYDGRYSISDKGIIYSHYRILNNGERLYRRQEVSKCADKKNGKPIVVKVVFCVGTSRKAYNVNKLMEEYFDLRPPDNYHFYELRSRDNDLFNTSLENLWWRIRTYKESEYLFYPQPFYDKKGKIVSKICGQCGANKPIDEFQLQVPKSGISKLTYRNRCKICRSSKQYAELKQDSVRYTKATTWKREWIRGPKGQKYFKKYRKIRAKMDKELVTRHYIASGMKAYLWGISAKDLPEGLVQLKRSIILAKRVIKQVKPFKND